MYLSSKHFFKCEFLFPLNKYTCHCSRRWKKKFKKVKVKSYPENRTRENLCLRRFLHRSIKTRIIAGCPSALCTRTWAKRRSYRCSATNKGWYDAYGCSRRRRRNAQRLHVQRIRTKGWSCSNHLFTRAPRVRDFKYELIINSTFLIELLPIQHRTLQQYYSNIAMLLQCYNNINNIAEILRQYCNVAAMLQQY